MGDVYRGRDTQTGQPVAIKVLQSEIVGGDLDSITRFIREGQALSQLNHPHIVKMIAALQEAGRQYLVMEYVGGGSLQDWLDAHGALPISRALQISAALSDALTHTHLRGIIHRDLKPTNVLLTEEGIPRLTDFGVAHVAGNVSLTQTGVRIGTVNYFSPEACNGERTDERADIWALGVMLYEMLTGRRPFTGRTIGETALSILTRPAPDLTLYCPHVSPTLADLIYGMLQKDRGKRIPRMQLVHAGLQLEAALLERGIPSPIGSVGPQP